MEFLTIVNISIQKHCHTLLKWTGYKLCESFSHLSCCSLDGGEHLLWCKDFMLGESVGTLGDEAREDLLLDLGGSPSLLIEHGTFPEA